MKLQGGYDVLRLIEHGSICYVSAEFVTGVPLIYWLKEHPNVTKEEFYGWIHSLVKQLMLIHRCRGNPGYRYVNPYCILVAEDRTVHYLDMDAGSNGELARQMQSRRIREHFLPTDFQNYRLSKEKVDIYGLGRTLQYILSVISVEPGLSRREESTFQKIISKCLKQNTKRSFQRISDIQKYIPKYEKKKKIIHIQKKFLIIMLISLCLVGCVGIICLKSSTVEEDSKQEHKMPEEEIGQASVASESRSTGASDKELALIYFLELGKPEISLECLEKDSEEDALNKELKLLIRMFEHPDSIDTTDYRMHLKVLEEELPKERKMYYQWFLVRGYDFLNTHSSERAQSKDFDDLIRIGQDYLGTSKERGKGREEVLEILAGAYEVSDQMEKAVEIYEQMLENNPDLRKKEALYKKISLLYEENEQIDQAIESCIKGVEACPESEELRNWHIRLICSNPSVDRELCSQIVAEYLKELPTLSESEEFKKLQKEYGIKVEGEKVWIEE